VPHVEVERRARLLGHQGKVDLAVAGEREAKHVGVGWHLAAERPGRLAQDQADPLRRGGQPLAGAQVERHAAPAVGVNPEPGGDEGVPV
jgi:hypothetical protein